MKTDTSGYTDIQILQRHRDAAMAQLRKSPAVIGQAVWVKVDPRPAVRQSPWKAVAGVAGATFLLTWLIRPGNLKRRIAALEKLARKRGGITGVDTTVYVDGKPLKTSLGDHARKSRSGTFESLAAKGFTMFRPVLAAAVSNWMHEGAKGPGEGDPDDHPGPASASAVAAESA